MIDVPVQILTVCFANICRSPAGESLLAARLGPDVRVFSRGVNAFPGATMCEVSRSWAEQNGGAGMIEHRSTQIEVADIQASTIILTASRRQREHVVAMRPVAQIKTFTIAQAARIAEHLIRIGEHAPATGPAERVQWLGELLNDQRALAPRVPDEQDDIPDPHRGGTHAEAFERLGAAIQTLSLALGLDH